MDKDQNDSRKQDSSSPTREAKQVIEEYIRDLRELITKLRRKLN